MPKNVVVVITTGGTIAMRDGGAGAVPSVAGGELLAGLPLPNGVEIQIEEFANVPSNHLTVAHLWQLQKTVVERLERLYVRGVVVTHGTDTMEETAYLLDYTVPSDKAVVLTGAMRTASDPAYDGAYNLAAAIRVALDPQSDGRGAMIVMNDEVHAARHATKATSHSASAFESPGWGPMARVYGERLLWGWGLARDALPVRSLVDDVHLLTVTSGGSERLLRHLVEQRVRGIVIEGAGAARVPPTWLPHVQAAIAQGSAVVVASRTAYGFTEDRYGYPGAYRDLEALGVIFAEGLSGRKARIRLMCALGAV